MAKVIKWTRPQTLAALHIYFQLPFGQLDHRNPKIKQIAPWIQRTPDAVTLKLTNLASLDPQVLARGKKGMGNSSKLDKEIWKELQTNWDKVALEAATAYEKLAANHGIDVDQDLVEELPVWAQGKTRAATIQIRVNQARFRKSVLASYNSTCCISGLKHEKLVIASHIVPWAEDTHNRLNPQNGLCLSALHDRAYDQGLITVMPDYKVRVSSKLKAVKGDEFIEESLLRFDQQTIQMPERFRPDPAFLTRHARRFGFI